jgi:homoserine O-succinyltransferase
MTGGEPRAARLSDWPAVTELVDWAEANTYSTIWSCLAAHAAVLHLDGIERQRLAQKCSGMYDYSKIIDNWLTDGLPPSLKVSHYLTVRGYRVLTKSKDAGADIFTKELRSQFVFFQGHPEYAVFRYSENICATSADISPATENSIRTFPKDISIQQLFPHWRNSGPVRWLSVIRRLLTNSSAKRHRGARSRGDDDLCEHSTA